MALCNVLVATLIANRRRPRALPSSSCSLLLLLRCCCSVGGGGGDDSVFFHQLLHRQCICIRRCWSSHTTIINRAPGPLLPLLEKEKGCRVCVRAERVPGERRRLWRIWWRLPRRQRGCFCSLHPAKALRHSQRTTSDGPRGRNRVCTAQPLEHQGDATVEQINIISTNK
jgi:hypothetical protein